MLAKNFNAQDLMQIDSHVSRVQMFTIIIGAKRVTNNNLTTLSWSLYSLIAWERSWSDSLDHGSLYNKNGNQNTWWSRWDLKTLKKEKGLHNWAHDHGHTCICSSKLDGEDEVVTTNVV